MSLLVLTRKNIEDAINENTSMYFVARAVKSDLPHLIGEENNPIYSVHSLFTGGVHVEKINRGCLSALEATRMINEKVDEYAGKTKESLIEALESDLSYLDIVDPKTLVQSSFYLDNLNRLNGHRKETVKQLNSILTKYGVPDEYRFN